MQQKSDIVRHVRLLMLLPELPFVNLGNENGEN